MAETESGIYYPTTEDPVRIPGDMQKLAESVDENYVATTAVKGDATLAEDGTLTLADEAVTSQKFKPTMGMLQSTMAVAAEGSTPKKLSVPALTLKPAVASTLLFAVSIFASAAPANLDWHGFYKLDGEEHAENPISGSWYERSSTRLYTEALSAGTEHTLEIFGTSEDAGTVHLKGSLVYMLMAA